MNLLDRMVEYLSGLNKKMKRWQRVVSVMSAVVVFVTTYALILPAITLDVDTASTQSGIEVASENEPDEAGTVFESTEEEEPTEEKEINDAEEASSDKQKEDSAEEAHTGSSETEAAQSGSVSADSAAAEEAAPSEDDSSAAKTTAETAKSSVTEDTPLITEKTQLTYKGKDYVVYADFDESAKLPVGVQLRVKEITKDSDPEAYETYYKKALEELKDKYDENTGLSFAKFYDIAFVFKGQEIEPQGSVAVKIEYKEAVEIQEETRIDAIHFDKEDEEKAEIIDSDKEVTDKTKVESVEFESDKFSVYGVIGAETFTEKFLTEDGETYNISVTAGAEAHIPSDAHLEVSEVKEGSDKYNELFSKTEAAVKDGKDVSVPFARFFDISIVKDGEKIQPDAPVEVKITFDETVEAEKNAVFSAVHISGDDAEVIDVTTEGDESENAVTVEAVQFSAEGFSYYGVTYTVDFEYTDPNTGKTYYFSINGEDSINLTDLLVILGIKSEDEVEKFVAEEVENVEFSDPELVKVTRKGKVLGMFGSEDWLLESLKPFNTEEKLTISLKDGGEIVVKVTDVATQDISSLLTDVNINATKNSDGSYSVYAGQAYSIELKFKEQPSGAQFDMTNGFYYDLPSGIFDADALTGKLFIELSGGDHAGETVELDYHMEGNRIVFSWPDQTSGAYQQLKEAIYTNFSIRIEGKFNENVSELEFSDTITKEIDVRTDGHADVNKSGTYNPKTNCIDYTVTVTSTGICNNVVVTDAISGSALTYNNDARARSSKGNSYTPVKNGNGFTFTIPQMGDGETVTVNYSAAVNLDALTRNDDGTLGTVSQTGNKVTVTPSNHPGDEDETSGKDFENKISYSNISKSASVGPTGEDGHATVTWTIKVNTDTNVSMAGHTISDLIDPASQSIMKYNGSGITVIRKDSNGATVGSAQTITWGNLPSHSDSAWTWTVPNSYPDTGKLSYEITYTTDVDVNGQLFNTTVKNNSTSDNGGSTSGSGDVTPVGGPLIARKVYIGKDLTGEEKTVTWEVNFDVPAAGLDSAVIDDALPLYWKDNEVHIDSYKEGTITITPELAFGEGYGVTTYTDDSGREHMVITFHKTDNNEQTVPGLSGTGSKRKIRVQFKTILNEEWLEAAQEDNGALVHTNNANVILNGQTLSTQASVKIDNTAPEISKTHEAETVNVYNNNQLPAWKFYITLSGVSDETFDENGQIVILDTYNSRYLDWYPHAYSDWEAQNGVVFGGDSDYKLKESSSNKVMTKVTDGQLKIVLDYGQLPMTSNGEYYPFYTIPYYLTVKDPIAWQKLITTATYTEGGAISLYNTAENEIFGETEDKVDYEVPVVDKSATEPTLQNGIYKLHYTIDINARALQLGDSDELVMTDDYSNISVDYTTLKIYEVVTDQWGNVTSRTEVNDVVWDRSGNHVTYYLKNATHYRIEYDAHLSGEGEEISDTQTKLTYSNTAEVYGKKSTWEKEKTIDNTGGGGSRTFRVKVLKHVKGNASQGLENAVFQLWWYPSTSDDPDGRSSRPDKNDAGWVNTGKTLTTNANGYAQTSDDMQIHSQTWYKLVEVTPPSGYTLKTTHYFFWITEDQVADYSNYVYINDDVLAINNTPELPDRVNVSVEKVWDDNSDVTLRRDINVHLYAEGQPYNDYFSGELSAEAREDANVTLHLNEDGTSEKYTWNGLPSGYTYSVVEDHVPGYVTTYSPKNTLTGGTLRITNKRNPDKTSIGVEKVWVDGTKPSEDVTVQLKRYISENAPVIIQNGANNAGATGGYITDYSVPAGATINIKWKYKNSWGYDSPALNIYNNATKELLEHIDKIQGNPTEHSVSLTVPADGIIVAFEEPYLDSISTFIGAFDFEIEVVSAGSGEKTEDVNFNSEHHYFTLNEDNNWHVDVEGLVTSDGDGAYAYYIEEVGVNDNTQTLEEAGYEVSYTNNDGITLGTITAENKKATGSVKVTKTFVDIEAGEIPDDFKITASWEENEEIQTRELTINGELPEGVSREGSDLTYTWTISGLPLPENEDDAGTVVTFVESGYDISGKQVTVTTSATAGEDAVTATAAKEPGEASFTNKYEEVQTTTISVTKEWKNRDNSDNAPPKAQVTFDLYRDGVIVDGMSITLDGTALGTEEASTVTYGEFAPWVATWNDLEAKDDSGKEYTYTVKEAGNGWEHYTVSYPLSDPDDPDSDPKEEASNGESITNIETTTDLEVDKQWFVNAANAAAGTPEKEPTVTTIYYKIMQKVGDAEATVYTYEDNQVQSLTYNLETKDWTPATHTGLPMKVYVEDETTPENSTWIDATYYVVECNEEGGELGDVDYADTYKKNEGTAGSAADAAVSASDTNRKITILNTDSYKDFKFKKVWLSNNYSSAESVDWVKPITVELHGIEPGESGTTVDTKISDYELTYPAPEEADYSVELVTETVDGKTYKSYEFTIPNLDAKYESFYVTEKEVDGYITAYGSIIGSESGSATMTIGQGRERAGEGEYIINSLVTVSLPNSGGPGTKLIYGMGISFVAMAGLLLFIKRRSIRDLSEGRW